MYFTADLFVFNIEEVAIFPQAHDHDSLFNKVALPDFSSLFVLSNSSALFSQCSPSTGQTLLN